MSKVIPLIPKERPDLKNFLECHYCKNKTFNIGNDGYYRYIVCDKCGLLMKAEKL